MNIGNEIPLSMYKNMFLARKSEDRLMELYRESLVKGTVTSGEGNEGAIVGVTTALNPETDVCNFMQRDFAGYLVWGVSVFHLFNHYLANEQSSTGGKDGNVHHGIPTKGLLPMVSHLGVMLPNVTGAVYARRKQGIPSVGVAIIGEGGTSTGDFHESLNIASVLKIPVLFMIENNQWAYSTPPKYQYACDDLASRAAGYGIKGNRIKATNAVEVYEAAKAIVDEMRRDPKPYLLETVTYRLVGHAAYDTADYVPQEDLDRWKIDDPLIVMRNYLVSGKVVDETKLKKLEEEWMADVSEQANRAIKLPKVTPERTNWAPYKEPNEKLLASLPPLHLADQTPVQAVNAALDHAMAHDPSVFLLGEDIGDYGGPFKATKGLFAKYGRDRVIDMPLAESGFTGFAIGAASMGLRPVIEMQFSDFSTDATTQIGVNGGTYYFRTGHPVPLTIRMPGGGGLSYGPFHSEDLEGLYGTFPGLKIVYPSFVDDYFELLLASIYDENPVLFFESKFLYRRLKGDIRFDGRIEPLGKARIRRQGENLTIVSYGAMMHECLAAVARVEEEEGVTIEVVDPRCLKPMDLDTVSESVKKTHRLLVAHEAWRTGSLGATLIAGIMERNFFDLDAPPLLVTPPDTPVPFAPELESVYRPNSTTIREKILELLKY
ncbi:MAG TPA: dehydrogenase E1 component subunit alpha/beta [Spirochaetia bacterium]|nr:dehydrogenase E1 component subunit alpha/beta [Spirochaetia bacterium]